MKIGEFARLSSATIRTLRYYDELDLLKPDKIDKFTGYRFYSSIKLEKMKQIQTMKEIGFTLLEIKSFLKIDEEDESAKIDFVAAKKREVEFENETRLNALDKFIVELKEEGKNMGNKKRGPCGVFDDEDINEWWKTIKEDGDASYGEDAAKLVKIYAGTMVFGAIDENGEAYIWGNNKHGQCNIPENLPAVIELGIGAYHAVALDADGKLHGWGSNQYGVIDFSNNSVELPKMISVKAEAYKTVALSEDGRVFSWGETNNGTQKDVPRNMGVVTQIAPASYHTAALNSEGKVFSWGLFFENQPPAVPDETSVIMIASTENGIVCLGADGKVYGDTRHTELNKKFKPKPDLPGIKKIIAGKRNIAAIDTDGRIYVWGEYDETEGGCAVVNIPANLPPIIDVAFEFYGISCLGSDGKIYAWGNFGSMVPAAFDGFGKGNEPIFESALAVNVNAPINVYTFEKFSEAVQNRIKNITIKGNFTIPDSVPAVEEVPGGTFYHNLNSSMNVNNDITVIIDEGVTLTVKSGNFNVMKKLINNGMIDGHTNMFGVGGRLIVYDEIGGTGSVADGFKIIFNGVKNIGEIRKYLAEDAIYAEAMYANPEEPILTIDSDLVIPKGKTLRVWGDQTLKINEGATLTVDGQVETLRKPIIEGKVIGKIRVTYTAQNPLEIYTCEEFCEALAGEILENGTGINFSKHIKLKNDIVVSGEDLIMDANSTMFIDEGVTFTVDSDLSINGTLINNGAICGAGKLTLNNPICGTGSVDMSSGLKFEIIDVGTDDLGTYLAAESIYSSVFYINPDIPNSFGGKSIFNVHPDAPKTVITIDSDLVIPAGKSLWLNINCVLRISEGATLRIDGMLTTFNEPVIEGLVIGGITIIDTDIPRNVYTFEEFYKAMRERTKKITVKADITVTGTFGNPINCDTLIIDENVTLTVRHLIFIKENLVNNGIVCGSANGHVSVSNAIQGSGKVNTANGLTISIINGDDKFSEYLATDSLYKEVSLIKKEENLVTIESDLVIPNGKKLWLNSYCTLKVNAGVTLKIDGSLTTYNEPVIEGLVIGKIGVLEKSPF